MSGDAAASRPRWFHWRRRQRPSAPGFFDRRFEAFLNGRIRPAPRVTLDQKRTYVFPTRTGALFGVFLVALMLVAINYQNSLVFGLAFLLASVFVVAILHTFRNLHGLTVSRGHSGDGFAGEDIGFEIVIERSRAAEAITLSWPGAPARSVDIEPRGRRIITLFHPGAGRGLLNPGRFLLETFYPTGLVRAWSWVDLAFETVIFPAPVDDGRIPPSSTGNDEGEIIERAGSDDFYGLKEYQPGDPHRHIAWKALARGVETPQVKQFVSYVDERAWLRWDSLAGLSTEQRLSRLCGWALRLARTDLEYGLSLPGTVIEPGRGESHLRQVLTSLALFES